jgi:hypothetical protein
MYHPNCVPVVVLALAEQFSPAQQIALALTAR